MVQWWRRERWKTKKKKNERKKEKVWGRNFEVMMKCDHYSVITLSVVDNKIMFLVLCETFFFMVLFISTQTTSKMKKRQKKIMCLIIEISCDLMTHIIIIKMTKQVAIVYEVKVFLYALRFSISLSIHSLYTALDYVYF